MVGQAVSSAWAGAPPLGGSASTLPLRRPGCRLISRRYGAPAGRPSIAGGVILDDCESAPDQRGSADRKGPKPVATDEDDHSYTSSLQGLVLEFRQSLLKKPHGEPSSETCDTPVADIDAEVRSAMSALQRVRIEGERVRDGLAQMQDEIDRLQHLNGQLRTFADDARRELTEASKALTAERERGDLLEGRVRSASARARSLEEWNATLRGHLDVLMASIHEDLSGRDRALKPMRGR